MAWRARARRASCAALACWALVCLSQPAGGQTTRPRPAARPARPVTDRAVRAAMDKAVAYLTSKQTDEGAFPNRHSDEYVGGGEALVSLSLLWAGLEPEKPPLSGALTYLKAQRPELTYTRCLRAMVYSLLPGKQYRAPLAGDVQWLLKHQHRSGGWGYGPGAAMTSFRADWTDASNSQFAMLALREAYDAGVAVPATAWRRAENYWRSFQNQTDGGWGYQPAPTKGRARRGESYGSMTAAGVASYFIFADKIGPTREAAFGPGKTRRDGRLHYAGQIGRGVKWLGDNYAISKIPKYVWLPQSAQLYYYLFTLLRVGDTAGLRRLAGQDYANDVAAELIATQKPDGSWNGSVIDTSFSLLCLARARGPVIINRLLLSSGPGRDPRDAANVARWLARRLRTPLTWQRVTPAEPQSLAEAPILYLNPAGPGTWPKPFNAAFRRFIRNGGTCLVQVPPDRHHFAKTFAAHCRKLFPDYRQVDLEADHPIFNVPYPVDPSARPVVTGIGDGCRTRIIILDSDVSGAWHQGRSKSYDYLFDLAGNIVYYAGGGRLPAGRFAAAAPPSAAPPARRQITIARLKHAGDYDACPLAVGRLSEMLARSRSIGLKELPAADPDKPISPAVTVLWLTGNVPPTFSDAQLANIRKYLQGGGTLLIDPATGRPDFRAAAGAMVGKLLGGGGLKDLPSGHPLITGSFAGGMGSDVGKARLLRDPSGKLPVGDAAWRRPGPAPEPPKLQAAAVDGRIAVVISTYGLACSIEGGPCLENVGYLPADARRLALNVILHAAAGSN